MTSFANNEGIQIAFDVQGGGEPLVLLHGFSQSRRAWRQAGFVEALTLAGREVILIDLRGHGESNKPHQPKAYDLWQRAGDVIAVLDALSIRRADLLGYSMGGAIAMATAVKFPSRCGALIVGGAQPYRQDMSFYRDVLQAGLQGWLAIIKAHVGPLAEEAQAMFLANDVEALRAAVAHDRPDLSKQLARTHSSMLFYAGADDPIHDLARGFATHAGCRFLSIPKLNHMQTFFAIEQVVPAALELIQRNAGVCGETSRVSAGRA